MPTKEEVTKFLEAFRTQVMAQGYYAAKTPKNQAGLLALGITRQHRRQVILSLTCDDYSSGPSPDIAYPGEPVWVFGAVVEGTEVYIKLKLPPEGKPTCISFHPAERRIEYPFRDPEEGRR